MLDSAHAGPAIRKRATAGAVALCVSLLGACAAHRPPQAASAGAPPPLTATYARQANAGKSVYRLDARRSRAWIFVDKAGPLAGFGHRHVIEVENPRGFAQVNAGGDTHAEVRFSASTLQVDPPAALARFDIKEHLSDKDRAGTRQHMLGSRVLDASRYPWIRLMVDVRHTRQGTVPLELRVVLHGKSKDFTVPATISHTGQDWTVKGAFSLKQSDFGITPYSIMLGALRVKDRIHIRYDLVFSPWHP